jgi:hypothetical protein
MYKVGLRKRVGVEFDTETGKYRMPTTIGEKLPTLFLLPEEFKLTITKKFYVKKNQSV